MKWQQHQQKQQSQSASKAILPLPQDVQSVADNGNRCENLSLWLDRFLTVERKQWKLTQESKHRERVEQLTQQQLKYVEVLHKRYEALIHWYKQHGFDVRHIKAKPLWRFVVGLGTVHVLETSITLHRLFGLPIIPGSALKGATRAYATLVDSKSDSDPEVTAIFGTTENAGSVIFFDAIPIQTEIKALRLDIMNAHYPNYYHTKGKKPPADWESPDTIFFLAVEKTPYLFTIAARTNEANALLDIAEQWLKGALRELGIGAKTSADYGYWEELP